MKNYSIIDMKGYAVAMRDGAARSFSEEYTENLDEFISVNQVINLVKKHSLGKDPDGFYIVNEKIFDAVFDALREWLYGVGLAKLSSKGLLECAWDDDMNEMTFWLPDKDQTHINSRPAELPNDKPKRRRKK